MAENIADAVRPIRAEDRADWGALWAGYLDFYESEVSLEVYDETFRRLLSDDPHEFNGMIAEQDGKAVGLAHFLFHRHAWKIENVCYLQDLYVAPAARGTGAAEALIRAVYAQADAAGAPSVYWLTQDFNLHARKLYDRVGVKTPFIRYNRPAS